MDCEAIVVGAGHAGIEASLALARLGFDTLLITQHLDTIGKLSCNPAVGGLAKGNMVREIAALGGEMGGIIDSTMIQFRVLNRSRGPAVQAPRAQADKMAYQISAKERLEDQKQLYIFQDTVERLLIDADQRKITGVRTVRGRVFRAAKVVVTTGTFLNGRIYIGEYTAEAGRLGEPAAHGLEVSLAEECGFRIGRLKTGTPARVHRDSLNFERMEQQFGDDEIVPFSFTDQPVDRPQIPCYITHTNAKTHQIISENLHRSPLYSGKIVGNGPRYCPSIEDKVVKFPQRDRHQIFVEPEGLRTKEMYLNGISSSLPEEVQEQFIHSIAGMEEAEIMRPGYAVEYDYIDPSQLFPSLEAKSVRGLYIAGQTNGSSGYEEAAGQGLMAGINAARALMNEPPVILKRSEAYIGVMIDDLVTLGTEEPYRMFTSRAEHRLALRHDTCDTRLTRIGYEIGLHSEEAWQRFQHKTRTIEQIKARLRSLSLNHERQGILKRVSGVERGVHGKKLHELLKMPEISLRHIVDAYPEVASGAEQRWLGEVEIDVKYEGYIVRQEAQISRFKKMEYVSIPQTVNYDDINGLSNEAREKFASVQPQSIGQAARISGVRNSDVTILILHIGRTATNARRHNGTNDGSHSGTNDGSRADNDNDTRDTSSAH